MTTDITELALIAKIKKQLENFDTVILKEDEALALVDALEKAKTKADIYDMLRDDYGLREKGVGLTCFVDWQAKRIAELESRTVKLPDLRQIVSGDRYVWSDGVYNYSQDVKVALSAAGIKWEAE